MTRSEQKLNKATKMLKDEYIKSQANTYVNKPMSYALYQVWKYFDKHENGRYERSE